MFYHNRLAYTILRNLPHSFMIKIPLPHTIKSQYMSHMRNISIIFQMKPRKRNSFKAAYEKPLMTSG